VPTVATGRKGIDSRWMLNFVYANTATQLRAVKKIIDFQAKCQMIPRDISLRTYIFAPGKPLKPEDSIFH
jgi:hypothetical protein